MNHPALAAVAEDIARCMRCGNCQAVCPLYSVTLRESMVARGKVHLGEALLRGDVEASRVLADRFDACLTCLACAANCPCGVRVDRIVLAARAVMADSGLLPLPKRAACAVMPNRPLLHAGARLLSRVQGLVFRRRELGMSPRFPVGLGMRRVVPSLPRAGFRELSSEVTPASPPAPGRPGPSQGGAAPSPAPARAPSPAPARAPAPAPAHAEGRIVALFTGCLADYVYPDVALGAVRVLSANGETVVAPRGQHCCGYPIIAAGKLDLAREMARSHVRLFSGLDVAAVITLCGTCGEAFIHHYPELLAQDRELGPAAAALASRAHDISRYLHSVSSLNPALLGPLDLAVTYHQPCHLGRGLGVEREPVDLLRAVPGITFIALRHPDRCCGGSGAFAFGHYDLADKVRRQKLADAAETRADVIVTGCGSCRMHLEEGLSHTGSAQRVLHTVEVLASSVSAGR